MFEDGSFVIAWQSDGQDGDGYGVYARRFDAHGYSLEDEFRVNTFTTGSQNMPAVASSLTGAFIVVWTSEDQDGDDLGVFGQLYDTSATPTGPEFQVNQESAGAQMVSDVAMAAEGSFVVTWRMSITGDTSDHSKVYFRRFDPTGTPLGPDRLAHIQDNLQQSIGRLTVATDGLTMAADGRFVIVWNDYDARCDPDDGDPAGIFAQRYDTTGNPLGTLPW
jgi:hypothetical protein